MTTQKQKTVYVVTRNTRRIEEQNYNTKEKAEVRAAQLVEVLKKWRDPDLKRVKVIETNTPRKIR
tara:strand:- start:502 stop:696 length:195 start_codon:yes stop_codon:yes gene_type:complete